MKPDLTFVWRGIEFEWSVPANAYIADTAFGRWMIQKHANNDNEWFARFGPHARNWRSSPGDAALHVLGVAEAAHKRTLEYLKALP